MNLARTFEQLKSVQGNPAVSLFMPTYRTAPDNEQDPILLKNELKNLEDRLVEENCDKRVIADIMTQIHSKTDTLDHHYNLDTLCIFATADQAHIVRLPFNVTPRVIIDTQFATRDLIRGLSESIHYDILVLSREKARLIEALNQELIQEYGNHNAVGDRHFPVENNGLHAKSSHREEAAVDQQHTKEFFHHVDLTLQAIHNGTHLPVIVVGEHRNVAAFRDASARPQILVGEVTNIGDLSESAGRIVHDVQEGLEAYRKSLYEQAQGEMAKAVSSGLLSTDLNTMLLNATEGRIEHLYVSKGYVQPGFIDTETYQITPTDNVNQPNVTDDVMNNVIETTVQNGGKASFIPLDMMPDQAKVAAKLRF